MAFVGRAVQVIWYLVIAVVVLVGLPWAAIHFVGWPLPRAVPNAATLKDWVDHPMTGQRFWKGVSIIGWIVWTALIVFLIIELLAQLGRIRAPRVRIRPLQGLAAGMVGATVAGVSSAAAHAAPPAVVATVPTLDPGLAGAVASEPYYVVERGDWLSAIAGRYLGDSDAYSRIAALNPQLADRGPSHIERGWRLRLPPDAWDRGIRLHAAGQQHWPTPTTNETTLDQPDDHAEPDTPAITATAPDVAASPHPTTAAAGSGDDAGIEPEIDDGSPDVVIGSSSTGAMAGAGLLASLLFAMLTAERRRQRNFFAAGQEPPLPRNGKAERELRAAQQPADVERLDTALRCLGDGLGNRRRQPDITGVRLVGADVQVLLAERDDDPPPPWLDEGNQWALPGYEQPPANDQQESPLPLLVTVGSRAGRHLLINLHRLGTLSIVGHPDKARDLLRHIVCELACATWSDRATIKLAGFDDEGNTMAEIGPDRIQTTGSVTEAADTVRAELARRMSTADVAAPPLVLVAANPDASGRSALATLHQALINAGRCGIAVIATVSAGAQLGVANLVVTDDGMVKVDLPGLRLTTDAAFVPVDMLDPLAQVFRAARLTTPITASPSAPDLPQPDDTRGPAQRVLTLFDPTSLTPDSLADDDDRPHLDARTPAPGTAVARDDADPTLDDDLAAWNDADPARPRIAILGPIQVHLPGELSDSKHRLYTETLLYLLTRATRSADRAQIEDALWYGNPAGEGSIRAAIARIRRWLGPRPDGGEWISEGHSPERAYRLADGILLDWHLLLRLRERGELRGEAGIADYRAALDLVRGVPMRDMPDQGKYRRPYTWIGDSDINPGRLIAAITDIAHRLAGESLEIGDTVTARWAVDQGWRADPDRGFDDLWLDRMRAEHIDGRNAELEHLVNEFREARDAEVLEDLQSRSYNLIRTLLTAA